MKKSRKITVLVAILAVSALYSCKSFLNEQPKGQLSEPVLANAKGVNALLVGAYAALPMWFNWATGAPWEESPDNWIYGSVAAGMAHKGSDASDQPPITPIANGNSDASNGFFNDKWRSDYEAVTRTNSVLKELAQVSDLTSSQKNEIEAEARFLRGHFYFDLKKMWNMVPWIDETTTDYNVANDQDIWPKIEDDFKFAMANLPATQSEVGRANKWAAAAYLAKTYMFEGKWADAKALYDQIIASGVNAAGVKYALTPNFFDNFDPAKENNSETVFAIQMVANDGSGDITRANYGDMLNFPYGPGAPTGCCGFFQPSLELVNSFRTDASGLPLAYNPQSNVFDFDLAANEVKSDYGVSSDAQFTPDTGNLDPRLDFTVARRGEPFLDWGPFPGQKWVRDQAYSGPNYGEKQMWKQSEGNAYDAHSWAPGTSINYNVIRYADVLLMAAEADVHQGDVADAMKYVNMVRARAANPTYWNSYKDNEPYAFAVVGSQAAMLASGAAQGDYVVRTDTKSTWSLIGDDPTVLANWNEYKDATYKIGLYTAATFGTGTTALDHIYLERKLELALEGHRYFDLVRWGIASNVINHYYKYEASKGLPDIVGAQFNAPKNNYFPIPQRQIDLSVVNGTALLKQNPGYQ